MMKKILSIILIVLWMMLIFNFSKDSGEESTSLTNEVITTIVTTFTGIEKNSEEMQRILDVTFIPIRKCAHFFVYFVLGLLVMNAMYICGINRKTLIVSSLVCILFSISDEFHQTFVDGRAGSIVDVLLDSSASLFASFMYHRFIIMRTYYEK